MKGADYRRYRNWNDHENGAFSGYVVAKEHVQLKIPANITDEEAATFGVSVTTVVRSPSLSLPPPSTIHPNPGIRKGEIQS